MRPLTWILVVFLLAFPVTATASSITWINDGADGWGALDDWDGPNIELIDDAVNDNDSRLSNLGDCSSSPCDLTASTTMNGNILLDSVHAANASAHHTAPTASTLSGVNAGTDLTADLEEEAHASEHAENAADEVLGESLGTACADGQILKADATGGLVCAADDTGAGSTSIVEDRFDMVVDLQDAGTWPVGATNDCEALRKAFEGGMDTTSSGDYRVSITGSATCDFSEMLDVGRYRIAWGYLPHDGSADPYTNNVDLSVAAEWMDCSGAPCTKNAGELFVEYHGVHVTLSVGAADEPVVGLQRGNQYNNGFGDGIVNGVVHESGSLQISLTGDNDDNKFLEAVLGLASTELLQSPSGDCGGTGAGGGGVIGVFDTGYLRNHSTTTIDIDFSGSNECTVGHVMQDTWNSAVETLRVRNANHGMIVYGTNAKTVSNATINGSNVGLSIGDYTNGGSRVFNADCVSGTCSAIEVGATARVRASTFEGNPGGNVVVYDGGFSGEYTEEASNAFDWNHGQLFYGGYCNHAGDRYKACGSDTDCPMAAACTPPSGTILVNGAETTAGMSGHRQNPLFYGYYLGENAIAAAGQNKMSLVGGNASGRFTASLVTDLFSDIVNEKEGTEDWQEVNGNCVDITQADAADAFPLHEGTGIRVDKVNVSCGATGMGMNLDNWASGAGAGTAIDWTTGTGALPSRQAFLRVYIPAEALDADGNDEMRDFSWALRVQIGDNPTDPDDWRFSHPSSGFGGAGVLQAGWNSLSIDLDNPTNDDAFDPDIDTIDTIRIFLEWGEADDTVPGFVFDNLYGRGQEMYAFGADAAATLPLNLDTMEADDTVWVPNYSGLVSNNMHYTRVSTSSTDTTFPDEECFQGENDNSASGVACAPAAVDIDGADAMSARFSIAPYDPVFYKWIDCHYGAETNWDAGDTFSIYLDEFSVADDGSAVTSLGAISVVTFTEYTSDKLTHDAINQLGAPKEFHALRKDDTTDGTGTPLALQVDCDLAWFPLPWLSR